MRTVQMTLDEDLVKAVDRISKRLHTSRSAFARKALREALSRFKVPILGNIAAGAPISAVEEAEEFDISSLFPDNKECYLLRVSGDSMIDPK